MEARKKRLIIMYHEIQRLRNVEHFSIQRIADYLSVNFRTVKKLLSMTEAQFEDYSEKKWAKPRLLDPYKDFIRAYLEKYQETPSAVMYDKLKEQFDSIPKVDLKTVYNYVMMIRRDFGIVRVNASERQYCAVPELPPGEMAQVDFGQKKLRTSTGEWVKVYFFIMLLCYSRHKFTVFRNKPFTSQDAAFAHEKGFEFFGGIPQQILYDQDSVFLYRENNGDYIMTEVFERYQMSRPFKVIFCHAADPESKGKVENTVKYIKQNFLFHRTYINDEILNEQALSWLSRTGNAMVHNTTRKIPKEQWAYEQPFLQKWTPLFPVIKENGYKVLKTNTIKYRGNIYSLPFGTYQNDDTKVYLVENENQLIIKNIGGGVITAHTIPEGVGNTVINTNHRRDTSLKLDVLRDKTKDFFGHSGEIVIFIEKINSLYPRYVRDQLTTVLSNAEKNGRIAAEIAMEFCVRNSLFSANDFKAILESQQLDKKRTVHETIIKPLGDAKTQLMAHIKPERSDINEYEVIFNQNLRNHESVYTSN
jgi:transposase